MYESVSRCNQFSGEILIGIGTYLKLVGFN